MVLLTSILIFVWDGYACTRCTTKSSLYINFMAARTNNSNIAIATLRRKICLHSPGVLREDVGATINDTSTNLISQSHISHNVILKKEIKFPDPPESVTSTSCQMHQFRSLSSF